MKKIENNRSEENKIIYDSVTGEVTSVRKKNKNGNLNCSTPDTREEVATCVYNVDSLRIPELSKEIIVPVKGDEFPPVCSVLIGRRKDGEKTESFLKGDKIVGETVLLERLLKAGMVSERECDVSGEHFVEILVPYKFENHTSQKTLVDQCGIDGEMLLKKCIVEYEVLFISDNGDEKYFNFKHVTYGSKAAKMDTVMNELESTIETIARHPNSKGIRYDKDTQKYVANFYDHYGFKHVHEFESIADLLKLFSSIRAVGIESDNTSMEKIVELLCLGNE